MTIKRINTTKRYSDATIVNGIMYYVEVPNNIAAEGKDNAAAQTNNIFDLTQRFLEAHDSGLDQLLMATVYLTDMKDFDAMNQVWDSRIPEGCAPVRACVQVAALAKPEYKVEIAFTAKVKS